MYPITYRHICILLYKNIDVLPCVAHTHDVVLDDWLCMHTYDIAYDILHVDVYAIYMLTCVARTQA